MKDFLQLFQDQLTARVPEIKYINEDLGQMDFYGDFPPVNWPCVLIDLQSGQFSNSGDHLQLGVLTVIIKIYVMQLGNSSALAPQAQKDEAQKGWELYENINKAIHGQNFLGDQYASPIRTSMQRVKRRDGIYERDITYTIAFSDHSCAPELTIAPQVSVSITT